MSGGKLFPSSVGTTADPWIDLRRHTTARIALGRSGVSLPTCEHLEFSLAHARARDAVHIPLDTILLSEQLKADGWAIIEASSRASSRTAYLARPDWGRRLNAESAAVLEKARTAGVDLVFVVSDGLSSTAVQTHAAPLLRSVREQLQGIHIGPIVIATQARVALADEVGQILGAKIAVSVIGERPGLSSPDSLGVYLTFGPKLGRNDSERNCISNIRSRGLGYAEASRQLAALIQEALAAGFSGVALRFDPGLPVLKSESA